MFAFYVREALLITYDPYESLDAFSLQKLMNLVSVLCYQLNIPSREILHFDLGCLDSIPKQSSDDGVNCGVYVCYVAFRLLMNEDLHSAPKINLNNDKMPLYREAILNRILDCYKRRQ